MSRDDDAQLSHVVALRDETVNKKCSLSSETFPLLSLTSTFTSSSHTQALIHFYIAQQFKMATALVCTPTKSRINNKICGRVDLLASPKSSPQPSSPSIHRAPAFIQTPSKTKNSPKSNIARASPRKFSELAVQVKKQRPKSTLRIPYNTADRFIPDRAASDFAKVHTATRTEAGSSVLAEGAAALTLDMEGLNLSSRDDDEDDYNHDKPSPRTVAYEASIAEACGISVKQRILAFKPAPPQSSKPIDLRSQYNRPLKPASALPGQQRRRILTSPERVLDAPNIVDDYYLNLLDWSCNNQVAIGLGQSVYVWSADTGNVAPLIEDVPDTYVSSLKWSGDGAYVSVGLGSGEVQIWDVEEGTKLRSMFGHDSRVSAMAWNKHLLTTGSRTGPLHTHDVRIAQHHTQTLSAHTGEVCGLEWRQDGAQLASGGNDNLVCIWDARALNAPKFQKTNHNAAVKALAWCPWQLNLLATGGGSHDRHIHFWNSTSGARVNSIDTGSQVTSLRWSTQYKELASTSGFPDNSISVWSYPSLVKNIEIPAHESRVLHSCLSPDGQTLATAAADESLKFWKIFEKKAGPVAKTVDRMAAAETIR